MDHAIRAFCTANALIVYQGFSLLTANRGVIAHPLILRIAQRYGRTPSQIVFRFAMDVGMLPLKGTTNATHMRADLNIFDFPLEPAEVELIESIGLSQGQALR